MKPIILRFSYLSFISCLSIFLGCGEKFAERLPPKGIVHFPLFMALGENTLIVSSSSSDGRYDFSNLVSFDTRQIKKSEKNITSSILIEQDPGPMLLARDNLAFVSKFSNRFFIIPVKDQKISCPDDTKITECPEASILDLPFEDGPFAIGSFNNNYIVSYLESDNLSIIEHKNNNLKSIKNLSAKKLIKDKTDKSFDLKHRINTKQVRATQGDVYFLFERNRTNKNYFIQNPTNAYLAKISQQELLSDKTEENIHVDFYNLFENFSIRSARDFYIDAQNQIAYVLSQVPSAIYKINLANNELMKITPTCPSASYMGFSSNPNTDLIVIPCPEDNVVMGVSKSTMQHIITSDYLGRGPNYALIDAENQLVYVSLYLDGTVAVLDFSLDFKNFLFEKAQPKHIGS